MYREGPAPVDPAAVAAGEEWERMRAAAVARMAQAARQPRGQAREERGTGAVSGIAGGGRGREAAHGVGL